MPNLLSGAKLRTGGSGQFIKLQDAMPQLPQSPSTSTGYTVNTNGVLVTSYSNSLGNIEFFNGTAYSNISGQPLTFVGTDSTSVIIQGGTETTGTSTGALVVNGGIGVNGSVFILSTLTAGEVNVLSTKINSDTSSINTATGALIVVGGVGIGENLNVGGQFTVTNTSTFKLDVTIQRDTNIYGELNVTGQRSVNLSPQAASITMQPSLGGSITIQPSAPGSIDAMTIGANVAEDGYFKTIHGATLTVTNTATIGGSVYSQDGVAEYDNLLYTPKITISTTAPANPKVGDFWINPTYGVECQYINDGGTYFWIQFTGF